MRPLPTGTLTLLFSDIEGSTSLLDRLGDQWGEALSTQRRIMRSAIADFAGHEMGTEGDSFFVVFTSAHDAVVAAIAAQRELLSHPWPDGVSLRVRIGIHTGEPQRHEDGYIGIDIHRAARIAATAGGGQIVVSDSTRTLLGSAEADFELRDLGWHRLKDLPDLERLFDVVAPGLIDEHGPLRSLGSRANFPTYASELVGRDTEVETLCAAIAEQGARLVTLTGPGGTGKTRLAVAVARELEHRTKSEIFFVDLHTADGPDSMWSGVAEAVKAPGSADLTAEVRTVNLLRDRVALLLLDNLEQIDHADGVVSQVLDQAPGVRVLATSRRPLHLVDEVQFPVPALPVPAVRPRAHLDEVQVGAVDLFVRRARMVAPGFALTPDNVADVVALCRRLDGLPLAIEIAAARVRLLSPRALLNRIDDRLSDSAVLAGRPERQRTLRATIAWSYDLLDPSDQQVFRRLGVFSSRFDLAAVAQLANTPDQDPLDVVAHLIDVSLVEIVEGPDGEPMIWLLDTVRRFARDQLREAGEYEQTRLAHARWCVQVAQQISGLLHGPTAVSALDRMDVVGQDIASALDWCLQESPEATRERHETGFALLEPMDRYWYRFGHIVEGRSWHDRALALLSGEATADSSTVVDALHGQGILAVQQLDLAAGTQALEQALAMAHRLGDISREARESNSLGIAKRESGDIATARALIERSLELARSIGDRGREATALTNMVHMFMDVGDYPAAVEAARRAVAADQAQGDPWGVAINQSNLVSALLNADGPQRAFEELSDVAEKVVAVGDLELSIDVIESFSAIWAALGDGRRAARLLGAADRQRDIAGIPRAAPDQRHLDRFLAPARQAMPDHEWRSIQDSGRILDIPAALAEGLSDKQVRIPQESFRISS